MTTLAREAETNLQNAYMDLRRCLAHLGLEKETSQIMHLDEVERAAAFAQLIERLRLPAPVGDLLAYGTAECDVRSRPPADAPHVLRLTPWLRSPWQRFQAKHPIQAFVKGDVDDVLKIGERPTEYIVIADYYKPGRTILAEVDDPALLDGFEAIEPLEQLLARTHEVNRWIGWIHALAKAGMVFWLVPPFGNAP